MTTPSLKSPVPPKGIMSPAPPPLLLTVRFSASLPDLELDIPRPASTTVVSLKHLIRSRLDKAHARRRLRFIHGGKILPDTAVLSSVLRALPPPPPPSSSTTLSSTTTGASDNGLATTNPERRSHHDETTTTTTTTKGKKSSKGKSIPGRPDPSPRIYVNCSIGDELTPADLKAEAQAASLPPPTSSSSSLVHPPRSTNQGLRLSTATTTTTTTPDLSSSTTTTTAPRGFDRLLTAGFTPSEVNQLRLQFRGIHASRYTPDTLPSPDTFRRMEDTWIDDNGAAATTTTTTTSASSTGMNNSGSGGGGGMLGMGVDGTDSDEVGLVGMVDVLIRGVITGFIWPLGSAGWLIREEGMSSDRWRFMVSVGVTFGVLIGFIRAISGDK